MSVTYEVRRSLAGADDWTVVASDLSEPAYRDGGLTVDTAYDYQVRGCNAAGCSEWSGSVTVTPIDIRYDVRQSLAGQNDWTVIATGLTDTEYLATELTPNTAYDFQVRACYLGACSAWSDIATETTDDAPIAGEEAETELTLALVLEVEPVSVDADITAEAEFVLALGMESDPVAVGHVEAEAEFVLALGVEVQPSTGAATAEVEFQLALSMEPEPAVTETADSGAALALALEVDPVVAHVAEIEFRLALGISENYTGPGTGIVAAGQRFTVNALREGDTFTVVLPWGGLEGMTGLAHVNSRTLRDDRHEQDINIAITPHDHANVPALAGGARPVAAADQQDYARRISRTERETDRIERNNR